MADIAQKPFSLAKSNFGVKGWVVIMLALFSVFLQSSIINDSLNVTIPAFSKTYSWDIRLLYIFSTVAAWIAVIGAAMWGAIAHNKSPRLVWMLALALVAVSCIAWSQTKMIWLYFVVLMAASIAGQGFNYIGNYSIISNWFPRKKGLAMGWVTIGFPLSAMVSVPLTSGIISGGGLEGLYQFYAGFAVILLILVFVFIKNYPEQADCFPDNDKSFNKAKADAELADGLKYFQTSPWTTKRLLKTKQVWIIGICFGVLGLISIGIMTNFMPRALQAGYEQSEIIAMLAITGVVACVGSYLCGVLDAKVGPKRATIYTLLLAVIAIIFNIIPTRFTMYISLPCFGFMLGGAANYLVSITNTIWGRYDFPKAYMVILPINNFVGAAGVSIVGVLGNMYSYTVAYVVIGILALIAAIVTTKLDDSKIGL